MARAAGALPRSVKRTWAAHRLAPQWVHTFKVSRNPAFGAKLHDVWLNAVEGFFAKLVSRRFRRGSFRSLVERQTAINRYPAEHNRNADLFVWTDPDWIVEKVARARRASPWPVQAEGQET